jgi:hypothetical protein
MGGHVHHEDMGQAAFGAQAMAAVQHGAQQGVGMQVPLHQALRLPVRHQLAGERRCALGVRRRFNPDAVKGAPGRLRRLGDGVWIAHQYRRDQVAVRRRHCAGQRIFTLRANDGCDGRGDVAAGGQQAFEMTMALHHQVGQVIRAEMTRLAGRDHVQFSTQGGTVRAVHAGGERDVILVLGDEMHPDRHFIADADRFAGFKTPGALARSWAGQALADHG